MAIRKSGTLSLDISIEILGREEFYGALALNWLKSQSRGLASTKDGDSFQQKLHRIFREVEMRDLGRIIAPSTPYGYVPEVMERFLDSLSGLNGFNLLRLRRLSIEWDDDLFQDIFLQKSFHCPTPILQELSLRCMYGQG